MKDSPPPQLGQHGFEVEAAREDDRAIAAAFGLVTGSLLGVVPALGEPDTARRSPGQKTLGADDAGAATGGTVVGNHALVPRWCAPQLWRRRRYNVKRRDVTAQFEACRMISEHTDALARLCLEHEVRSLEVFGSASRSEGYDAGHSDLDFLVEFLPLRAGERADTYFGLLESLQSLFGRSVDLVVVGAVKESVLPGSREPRAGTRVYRLKTGSTLRMCDVLPSSCVTLSTGVAWMGTGLMLSCDQRSSGSSRSLARHSTDCRNQILAPWRASAITSASLVSATS